MRLFLKFTALSLLSHLMYGALPIHLLIQYPGNLAEWSKAMHSRTPPCPIQWGRIALSKDA